MSYFVCERNKLKAYRDEVYVEDPIYCCETLEDAQDLVLAFTEDYIYTAFIRECNNCGLDTALWLFQHSPKYGWDKYSIKPVKEA